MFYEILLTFLALWANRLSIVLVISYLLSVPARYYWVFDLFANFLIQYAIGGLVLGVTFLCFQNYLQGLLCLAIFAGSLYRIKQAFPAAPPAPEGGKRITIAHYNRLYSNDHYDKLTDWLRKNAGVFDIVSIHETTTETLTKLESVKDIYPYRFPETKRPDTDVCFLSRYPIVESGMITIKAEIPTLPGLRIKVETPAGPLTVYGIHAESPLDHKLQWQRNEELGAMAKVIAADPSPNIVFLGDWNITPFSPHFADLLKVSKLNNHYVGPWPPLTWPVRFGLPFLKIPIDHILAGPNMKLVQKKTGPSMGSDHLSLVATFAVP